MASSLESTLHVALIGNPNTGKSTLFTALVGIHQRVGNYPGVTVEKKTGQTEFGGRRVEVVDLPGLYSLAPRSRDEMVAVDLLLGRQADAEPVDVILCIVDASNLRRNLYLVNQVLELGRPTVIALNMLDVAERQGVAVDASRLARHLGLPVIPMQANRGLGVAELQEALAAVVDQPVPAFPSPLPEAFQAEVTHLETLLDEGPADERLPRCLVQRLLLDVSGYLQGLLLPKSDGTLRAALEEARQRLASSGHRVPGVETTARYAWIETVLDGVVTEPQEYRTTVTDRLDRVLTHRLWGTLLFAGVMAVVFQAVFVGAEPFMRLIERGVDGVGQLVEAHLADGALRSLLVQGVIHGAGGVLVFLPQIAILFFFIAMLEDCGYMARAAYLMDRLMSRIGLSGKSFIPMLSSFACAIPGIMAARVIEDERDRLTTILVAPLMTCSARLPVYALLIAAFIPAQAYLGGLVSLQGLTLLSLYLLGIGTAIAAALIFKRTILRGATPPFVMELPSYKWPSPRTVFYRVLERAFSFVRCAGTIILAVSVVVWAALYYPHNAAEVEAPFQTQRAELENQLAHRPLDDPARPALIEQQEQLQRHIAAAYQRQSLLGHLGRAIEPVFWPLGWDWRIGTAVIASFPAREVVVATLSVVFDQGTDVDPKAPQGFAQLGQKLREATWEGSNRPLMTLPVALSILVFFALCAQCAATLAVIRRETNSWRWPLFTFGYMTVLAYAGAALTYHLGSWLAG